MAKHKQQNGFTLVEAVVTIAIVAVMSSLVLTGTSGARDKFQVRNAAQQFANSLREAILMTKNGINVTGACPGIKRECSSYKVVIPTAGGDSYDRKVIVGGADYGKVTFLLPGGVKFLTTTNNVTASFIFSFPNTSSSGTLNFELGSKKDTSIKSCVSIVSGGAVSVKTGAC